MNKRVNKTLAATLTQADVIIMIRLINSVMYGIKEVFIILHKESCRLIAMNDDVILHDDEYKKIRGAKIAFSRKFGNKAFDIEKEVKAQWSTAYPVDPAWLRPRIEKAEKFRYDKLKERENE
jgi:hypothetical protein